MLARIKALAQRYRVVIFVVALAVFLGGVGYAIQQSAIDPDKVEAGTFLAIMSDMKVRVDSHDVSYYPDVSVVCDSQDKDPYVKRKPCVVVEVLSSTTEATDRREKWLAYRSIPSLCYYLLVSSDRKRVEYFARGPEGAWESALMDEDDTLSIVCEGYSAQLTLAAIYEDVRLPSSHRFAV